MTLLERIDRLNEPHPFEAEEDCFTFDMIVLTTSPVTYEVFQNELSSSSSHPNINANVCSDISLLTIFRVDITFISS